MNSERLKVNSSMTAKLNIAGLPHGLANAVYKT